MKKQELFDELEKRGMSAGEIVFMWPIFSRFVARWIITRPGLLPVQPDDLMRQWQEDMQ